LAQKVTIEDPSLKDENERIRRFGQRDHVRMYSPIGYPERLRDAGFEVSITPYPQKLGPDMVARHALVADEIVFFCQKPR
jgi:hypothetical protein